MANWHEQMADAVKLREKAVNGVVRWTERQKAAEQLIEELSTRRQEGAALPLAQPAVAPESFPSFASAPAAQ